MEIKTTVVTIILLCALNSTFFFTFSRRDEGWLDAPNQVQHLPVFSFDEGKQVKVIKVPKEETQEEPEEQEDTSAEVVESQPNSVTITYNPTPPTPSANEQEADTASQENNTPEQDPPGDPPDPPAEEEAEEPDPDPFFDFPDDIGGPSV